MGSAENYRNSEAVTVETMTERRRLSIPQGIRLMVTTNSLTVSWSAAPLEVDEYVISITPLNQERTLDTNLSETTFGNLNANAEYTITVVAQTANARYTESAVYRELITTDVLGTLSAPIVTARTENRRGSIRIEWDRVDNAQSYIVQLYEGASNEDVSKC
ncbi:MAG: fibronectin type III domain-containing protein [Candidatus Oxydemutatoraceae bacterium WSBS_2016_MAG_OTU14]